MVPLRHIAATVCGVALLGAPARAAVLISDYALRGALTDQDGGNPLTTAGGQITALGYVFAANQGFSFSNTLFTPAAYSIELSFRLNSISGDGKIVDFQNLTTDAGLYQHNGSLDFVPTTTSGALDFAAGVNVQVVLTRDSATNLVAGYVNGQQQFSFTDANGLALSAGTPTRLNFFTDDLTSGQTQAGSGTVNSLRIYNGALTAAEVKALYAVGTPNPVPEPETYLLFSAGAMVLWAVRRRRGRS